MILPTKVVIATITTELPGISTYVTRHNWEFTWDVDNLTMEFRGSHPNDNSLVLLKAHVDDYNALPPKWIFYPPTNTGAEKIVFPKQGSPKNGGGSIFHGKNIICAPFNRLAYKSEGGIHADWGGPQNWLNIKGNNRIRETTIAGMFASILGHLKVSPGMK